MAPYAQIEEAVPDQSPECKNLIMLAWLPSWARSRLVMKLALAFAREDKPLPLGLVAGQAIPWVVWITMGRVLFCSIYVVLVKNLSVCPEAGYPRYPVTAWLAWIPFQFMVLSCEIQCLTVIAVPKIQVLGIPEASYLGWQIPFALWFCFRIGLSVMGGIDFVSDAAYVGLQLRMQDCQYGLAESVWREVWQQSLLGKFGLDGLIPEWTACSFIAWSVNFVPITYALLQGLPKSSIGDIDYAIVHDASPTKFPSTGDHVEFVNGHLVVKEGHGWTAKYNAWQAKDQNHGAALTCLADVNGMELLTFQDFEYAQKKAEGVYAGAKNKPTPNIEDSKMIVNHIMSQVRRISQKTVLSGALTNGLQLNVQITAIAMFQYDRPISNQDCQAFFSIMLSASMLVGKLYSAVKVLWSCHKWLSKLEELEEDTTTQGSEIEANSRDVRMSSQRSERSSLARRAASLIMSTGGDQPSDELRRGMRWLFVGAVLCSFLVIYAIAKMVMLSACPYSLWNITGCFVPQAGAKPPSS